MGADTVVLTAAAIFLALCLATFGWALRPTATGYRNTVLVFTWLCAALAATLVIFSLFPDSGVEGDVFGFTLGGAGAFVMLVWGSAIRANRAAGRRDDADRRIAELEQELARAARRTRPLVFVERQLYDLSAVKSRCVGIVTGDVRQVRFADVWVNSENTHMSMADPYDNSISGIVRYEGSRKSPWGHMVDDLIGEELDRKIASHRPVAPGTAVVTTPGELRRNGVRWIVHVASVVGQPGEGYRQIRDVGRCVTNALTAVDNGNAPLGRSVLLPLLGTGYGRGELEQTARVLLGAVISYFVQHARTAIREVYLLAHTDDELAACEKVFAESDRLILPGRRVP